MSESDAQKAALDYAWDWFSYHAGQRLVTFRFFLLIVGILIVGYFQCVEHGWRTLGTLAGLFGGLISVAFWILEIRNEELVNCGRKALDELEKTVNLTIRKDDKDRSMLQNSLGPVSALVHRRFGNDIMKHRFWLRSIHLVTGVGFVVAAVYALFGFGLR